MRHVDTAIREAFNTSHVRQLREACRLERLLLAAVALDARYSGRDEVVLESVIARLRALCVANSEPLYAAGAVVECMVALGSKRLVICDPGRSIIPNCGFEAGMLS
jgi:origin recognition complex subunit 1